MELRSELTNYSAVLIPVIAATLAVLFPGTSPQRRLISVVVPAACSVLAVGFGLQGLTRSCFDNQLLCDGGGLVIDFFGNTFGDQMNCRSCASAVSETVVTLNHSRPYVVIGAAILCCQLSALSLIMFVKWMRRMENAQ